MFGELSELFFFLKPKSLVDQCLLPSVIYGYKLIDLSIFKKSALFPVCVSVSIPGWPWISCVAEDDLGLLILDLPSAGFINMCCHPSLYNTRG